MDNFLLFTAQQTVNDNKLMLLSYYDINVLPASIGAVHNRLIIKLSETSFLKRFYHSTVSLRANKLYLSTDCRFSVTAYLL